MRAMVIWPQRQQGIGPALVRRELAQLAVEGDQSDLNVVILWKIVGRGFQYVDGRGGLPGAVQRQGVDIAITQVSWR